MQNSCDYSRVNEMRLLLPPCALGRAGSVWKKADACESAAMEDPVKLGSVQLYPSPAWQRHEFPQSLCILNGCNKFCLNLENGCLAEDGRGPGTALS